MLGEKFIKRFGYGLEIEMDLKHALLQGFEKLFYHLPTPFKSKLKSIPCGNGSIL